jgi:hypothetical protein
MFQNIGRTAFWFYIFMLLAGFLAFLSGDFSSGGFFRQLPTSLVITLVSYVIFDGSIGNDGPNRSQNQNGLRQVNRINSSPPPIAHEMYESNLPASAPVVQATPQQLAAAAMTRAGVAAANWQLGLKDLGILAYGQDRSKPDIVRTTPIGAHVDNLRPFLIIDLPYARGHGNITIEFVDEQGKIHYQSVETYKLIEGENFITPKTWFSLSDQHKAGQWRMNVRIGKRPLASHEFMLRASVPMAAEELITYDGELQPQIARLANNSSGTGLSLDDMIASQYEDDDLSEASADSLR